MRTLTALISICALAACGPNKRTAGGGDDTGGGTDGGGGSNGGSNTGCSGNSCSSSCEAAIENHSSVGCEYYAVDMDGATGPPYDACYAVFVANVSRDARARRRRLGRPGRSTSRSSRSCRGHRHVARRTARTIRRPASRRARSRSCSSTTRSTSPRSRTSTCPVPAALGSGVQVHGTGIGTAFHITTDTPVVAYQMLPYGGGNAAATGASLLIPTSAWQSNYVAVSAWDDAAPADPDQHRRAVARHRRDVGRHHRDDAADARTSRRAPACRPARRTRRGRSR